MRKTFAVLAVASLMVVPSVAHAQLGVKGGVTFSNVSNSGVLPGDNGQRAGFTIGLGLQTPGPIGFGIEGLYSQRGLDSRKLDYIDVPVYLRVEASNMAVSPFAYVGPQVSFELNCDFDTVACPSGRDKVTYAGVIGAGLRFGVRAFSLEARYAYGLSNLELETISSSENYRSRDFMLLAGIGF